jgi:Domain of unknown function (DUF5671)
MDKPKTTAKDFFLWAGAMVAFYWSAIAFIFLIFNYINYSFPNALSYYSGDPYQGGISYEMASIIILFPLYMFLMRFIRADIMKDSSRGEIWVRRWLLILTLFVSGLTIVIDLVTLLTTFLNGEELSAAFLLKVLVIFIVAGGIFMHFIMDLRGYWTTFPERKRYESIGVGVLVLVSIVSGFFIVGTPQQARGYRFDEQKINDLVSLQSQVVEYYRAKQALPVSLSDLNDPLSYNVVPSDPQTEEMYGYETTGALSFKICANFNAQSREYGNTPAYTAPAPRAIPVGGKGTVADNWKHGAGNQCFDRTIDSSLYPPTGKSQI